MQLKIKFYTFYLHFLSTLIFLIKQSHLTKKYKLILFSAIMTKQFIESYQNHRTIYIAVFNIVNSH